MPEEFSSSHLEALFDPARYLGEAPAFIDSVLAHHRYRKE
jgi:adenylosuccinate lyase